MAPFGFKRRRFNAGLECFTFTTAVASGAAYAVTVFTQPTSPAQNCAVTSGSGNASANVTNVQVTCTTTTTGTFTIGGTVTNLVGSGLVLQDNGGDNLSVTANGSFTFTTAVASGAAYAVTVSAPPSSPAQTCGVVNGSGAANANVTNITVNCGHNEWAWMSGSNDATKNGATYGTLGVAAAANVPGFRNFGAVSWTDTSGNLWLFGGNEATPQTPTNSGDLNDLWKYNIASGLWTWVSGSNSLNQNGNYGVLNTAATTNVPGTRDSAVSWIDSSGNLWLFGGFGNDSVGTVGYLNDLWEYSVSSNEWTWKGGSNLANQNGNFGTLNVAAATNVPSGRGFSTVQNISGEVWLFGGFGNDSSAPPGTQGNLNDLWEYTISSGVWTWMGGSNLVGQVGVYGTKGTAALGNIPGARYSSVTWTDTSGNFWLFGGSNLEADGVTVDFYNDLWEFSTVSKEWTWMNGTNLLNQNGTYGVLGTAALGNTPGARGNLFSWTDLSGNFWLFGGFGNDSTAPQVELNDLWEYSVSSNEWTWKNGPNVGNLDGTFGTLGQLAPGNIPASRDGGASWTDASGNFWLFSGEGTNTFNDLWMYLP